MQPPVFIGNELAAAGYRLAGVQVADAAVESARVLFDRFLALRPPLLLIGESCIPAIGEAKLLAAIAEANPPVLIVADRPGRSFHDTLPESIRQELGVAA
jgi:vacuolar-type H+-ATPase subunit F/Vma7